MTDLRTPLLAAIACVLGWSGCQKEQDTNGQPTEVSTIIYQNEPDAEDVLLAEAFSEESQLRAYYYGNTGGDGLPVTVYGIAAQRTGSDTVFNFIFNEQHLITDVYLVIGGIRNEMRHHFVYPDEQTIHYILYNRNWATGEQSIEFFASVDKQNGNFDPTVYVGKWSGTEGVEWGSVVAQGLYNVIGVAASVGIGVLGAGINPVLGVAGGLAVFGAFFGSDAHADEFMPPGSNPDAPESPSIVAEELQEDDNCDDSPLAVMIGTDADNELTALPTGVSGTFQFYWSTGETETAQNFHSITAPGPGEYSVLVIDESNCYAFGTATIEGDCGESDLWMTASYVSGTLTLYATGGAPPYAFSWSPDLGQDWQVTEAGEYNVSIPPGAHVVTVTDDHGCTLSTTINPDCEGNMMVDIQNAAGTLTASAYGGTPPYTFVWSNGETGQHVAEPESGSLTVTATDAEGCTASGEFHVSCDGSLSVTLTHGSGMLTASATGGTPPYSYQWDGACCGHEVEATPGVHTVTVYDEHGCTATAGYSVSCDISTLSVNITHDGYYMTANASGGVPPYEYEWSNGEDHIPAGPNVIIPLTFGNTYTVTVTDESGCTVTGSALFEACINVVVTQPTYSSVQASASGGVPPYQYQWKILQGTCGGSFNEFHSGATLDCSPCSGSWYDPNLSEQEQNGGSGPLTGISPGPHVMLCITDAGGCSQLFNLGRLTVWHWQDIESHPQTWTSPHSPAPSQQTCQGQGF